MTRSRIFFLLLFLLVPSFIIAQTSRVQSAANKAWPSFWSKFSAAVNKKDRKALRQMMSDDFDFSFDSGPSEWINEHMDKYNMWRDHQRAIASGTRPYKYSPNPARVTKDHFLYFEFRNGRWYWTGVKGEDD